MTRTLLSIAGIVFLVSLITFANTHSAEQNLDYTLEEVMEAYRLGKFRIIRTNNTIINLSSNNKYAYSLNDGVYRISDSKYYEQLNNIEFSPDGNYAMQNGQGVYHLLNEEWLLTSTKAFVLSNNSEYIGVTEAGIYRLSNQLKVFDTTSPEIRFSPDSTLVATLDGIYRLTDGQKLVNTSETLANFSPDSKYAWTRRDGLYRLNDGKKLIDITTPFEVSFIPNSAYVIILGDGVYNLNTGELVFKMDDRQLEYVQPKYSPCGKHIIINGEGVYRISDWQKLFNTTDIAISPNCTYIIVGNDGVYRLDDMQKLLTITGWVGGDSEFSDDEAYLAIPGAGTYRTSDWQRILDKGSFATFSPSETYIAIDWDGVYRITDGQKLFDIEGIVNEFSPSENYLSVGFVENDGIYHIATGDHYPGLRILDVSTGILAIGNTIVVIDETVENQLYSFGIVNGSGTFLRSQPNSTSAELIYISAGVQLAILDKNDGWYKVGYGGEIGWILAENLILFSIPK